LTQVEKAVKGEEVAKVTTSAPPFDMGNLFIILIAIGLYLYGKPLIKERLSINYLFDNFLFIKVMITVVKLIQSLFA